jgi:uncharacterized membrane protein
MDKQFLYSLLLMPVLDIPWLYIQSTYNPFFKNARGALWAVIPVYLALAYLMKFANSVKEAFILGSLTYAVYDFTNYATLSNYPLSFALLDTVWGGVLFGLVYYFVYEK